MAATTLIEDVVRKLSTPETGEFSVVVDNAHDTAQADILTSSQS